MSAVPEHADTPAPPEDLATWPALEQFVELAAKRLAACPPERGMAVTLVGESAAVRTATLELMEKRLRDAHGCRTLRVEPWRYQDAGDYWGRIGAALYDGLAEADTRGDENLRLRAIALDEQGSPRGRLALDRLLQVLLPARGGSTRPLVVLVDDRHAATPAVDAAVHASLHSLFRRPGVVTLMLEGQAPVATVDLLLQLPMVPRTAFTGFMQGTLVEAGLLAGHTEKPSLDAGWVPVLRRAFYPRLSEARRFIAHLRFEVERFRATAPGEEHAVARRNDLQRLAFLACLDWCHREFVIGLRRGGLEPDDVLSHQARFLASWPDDDLHAYESIDDTATGADGEEDAEQSLRALFVQCFRSGAVLEGRPLVPPFSGPAHVAALLYFRAAGERTATGGAAPRGSVGRWWHTLLGRGDTMEAGPAAPTAGVPAQAREELRQLREDAAWAGVLPADEAQALRAAPERLRRALQAALARCTDERTRMELTLRLVRLDISEGEFETATSRARELEQQIGAEDPYRLFAVHALQITAHDLAGEWQQAQQRLDDSLQLALQTGLGHVRRDLLLRRARLQFHSPLQAEQLAARRTIEQALAAAREVDTPADVLREFEAWRDLVDPGSDAPPAVFVSYAHEDRDWRDWVCERLETLSGGGRRFSIWYDHRDIAPGRSWLEQILSALDRSRYSLLLVSNAFLQSRFVGCFELARIDRRLRQRPHLGHVSLPLHLQRTTQSPGAADAPTWLDELQALNDPQGEPLADGRRVSFVDMDETARNAAWGVIAARLESAMGLAPVVEPADDGESSSSSADDERAAD